MIHIAIDIGGTFTDIVCLEDETRLHIAKVPTTPSELVRGVSQGVDKILAICGREPGDVARFIHSTTIATNAILEQKGAITGVLMTEGFEDVLEIGRQKRSDMYNLFLDAETPSFLSPRRMRVGIPERVDAAGEIVKPLDEGTLLEQVGFLREQYGVQSLAVCYLFSFLNPAHELRTQELLAQHFPELSVSLSSEIDPVFREFERVTLTAFDAYVRPRVALYMAQLEQQLKTMGIGATLQVMQSRGGLTSVSTATAKPVTMLLSGPAAGVIGGRFTGAQSNLSNLVTVDIGGTSCDVALIKEGKALISREGHIRHYPLRTSMVDVSTVGAGGGSMAWVDSGGGLRVGPESAGADPGPACYGQGGEVPTVTDASMVLGYLNPDYFAGGDMPMNPDAALSVIRTMAGTLAMEPLQLASGIHRIINERMSDEIRLVSVRRGYDARQFALVALGGAGPVHAGRLAKILSIPTIVVPVAPGVLSAFGLLVANVEHEHTRTFALISDRVTFAALEAVFSELDSQGRDKMKLDNVPEEDVLIARFGDLRYVGQSYELEVPLPMDLDEGSVTEAVAAFNDAHQRVYGHCRDNNPVEFVNLRTVHSALQSAPRLSAPQSVGRLEDALKSTRPAYFDEFGEFRDTRVYDRERIPVGETLTGPAIIEQPDTTTVLYPQHVCRVDSTGNMVITVP